MMQVTNALGDGERSFSHVFVPSLGASRPPRPDVRARSFNASLDGGLRPAGPPGVGRDTLALPPATAESL